MKGGSGGRFGFAEDGGDGRLDHAHLDAIGHFDLDFVVILDLDHLADDATLGDHLIATAQGLDHGLMLFDLFLLRADQQEVHDREDQDEREKLAERANVHGMFLLSELRTPARDFGDTYAQNRGFARRGDAQKRRMTGVHTLYIPPSYPRAARAPLGSAPIARHCVRDWSRAEILLKHDKPDLLDWLGLRHKPDFSNARWLGGLVATTASALFLLLLIGTVIEFVKASWSDDPDAVALRNAGLVLAAIAGIPFLIWRAVVAQKQADVAEQALFNDKLKAAADDLHARREIKRKNRLQDATERDFIEDDIVRRVAAIDRLEGLAEERPSEAPRIARLLCVYLRHLSKGITPDNEEHPRADMEAAAQTIGRMKMIPGVETDKVVIDLRGANLAGFDLSGLCFDGALLHKSHLIGTILRKTKLRNALLYECDLQPADMRKTRLEGARFWKVRFDFKPGEEKQLLNARLRGAAFSETRLTMPIIIGLKERPVFLDSSVIEASWSDLHVWETTVEMDLEPGELRERMRSELNFPAMDSWHSAYLAWRAWQKEIGFDPDDPSTW